MSGLRRLVSVFAQLQSSNAVAAGLSVLFPAAFLHALNKSGMRNQHEFGRAMVLRGRQYVEAKHREIRLSAVARQVMAVMSHYISYKRLRFLRDLAFPILAVAGGQDNLVSSHNSTKLAKALNAELLLFDDAGHGVNEQHAAEFNAALERIVARGAAAQPSSSERAPRRKQPPELHPWFALVGFVTVLLYCTLYMRRASEELLIASAGLMGAVFLAHVLL